MESVPPEVPSKKADQHRRLMGRGKWSQRDVPHKGWTCVRVDDLGEPSVTCEMCEFQAIRYVHHMSHPEYPAAWMSVVTAQGSCQVTLRESNIATAKCAIGRSVSIVFLRANGTHCPASARFVPSTQSRSLWHTTLFAGGVQLCEIRRQCVSANPKELTLLKET